MEETKEIKMSKKDKVKNFIKEHGEFIFNMAVLSTTFIIGYNYGKADKKKFNAEKMVEFAKLYEDDVEKECEEAIKCFAKVVAPKENVKYVIERFHDAAGKTCGTLEEYISENYKLIEKKED